MAAVLVGACAKPQRPERWEMPDLVGETFQVAHDRIKDLSDGTVPVTATHDVDFETDTRILDLWRVCAQRPAPGEVLTSESVAEFELVRVDESCP